MKQHLLTLFLALAASVAPLFAQSGTCGDNLTWTLDTESGTLTISGTGTMKDYGYYNNTPWSSYSFSITDVNILNGVTSIGSFAFFNCRSLTSITIPNSVASIGNRAFYDCNELTSIEIPKSVTSIGSEAFSGCNSLTSLKIPYKVTIGNKAFYNVPNIVYNGIQTGSPWGARSLNGYVTGYLVYNNNTKTNLLACSAAARGKIEIPNSVTSIREDAFHGCGLISIELPNSVTSIDDRTFYGCGLISLEIPNSVTSIGSQAFYDCSILKSITIPNSVISIGERAFRNCSSLTSITIPNSVTSIGEQAFYECRSLTSVTIGNSVTSIGDYAFYGCSSLPVINNLRYADTYLVEAVDKTLSTYTIKEGTRWIGSRAFYGCNILRSITIPNSVIGIGSSAFSSCNSLPVIDNIRYADTYLVEAVDKTLSTYSIKEGTKRIGSCAFSGCNNLTSIIIPYSVTSIGNSAFNRLNGLTSIQIPNSVTSIGQSAFAYCSSLTSITIPNSVKSIEDSTFYHCNSLISIEIPNSITRIGNYAFDGCSSLPVIDNIRYADTYLVEAIDKTLSTYTIKEGTRWIGNYAFRNCSSLTSIEIPNSITSIGDNTFSDCKIDHIYFFGTMKEWCEKTYNPTQISPYGYWLYIDGKIVNFRIEITNDITHIGDNAFAGLFHHREEYGLLATEVILNSSIPPTLGKDVFSSSTIINVPFGSLSDYKKTSNWYNYSLHVINPSHSSFSSSATSATITFGNHEEAKHIAHCGMEGGEEFAGNVIECIGLKPNNLYANIPFFVKTKEGDYDIIIASFSTSALTLTTLASKAVSANTAILLAETNMSDAETSCGFEWRRNDQPEDMASNQVLCPVANGLLAGRLKGLRDDTYYKYRAFYKSAAGNMYYGDWQYIFTGDVAVEFDPVLYTYAAQFVSDRKATLKGYALPGADDFTEQGFEYWAESRRTNAPARRAPQYTIGEKHTITGTGISMRVTLEDLDEGTVYKYRTYAKVGGKTLYGTEMSFTTEGEWIEYTLTANSDDAAAGSVTGSGTYHTGTEVSIEAVPATGYRFVEWSDGNTDNPRTVVLTEDMTITALFERLPDALGETQSDNLHNARKYILNGVLYIRTNGTTYNAQGHRID